jgi:hypothetical protein
VQEREVRTVRAAELVAAKRRPATAPFARQTGRSVRPMSRGGEPTPVDLTYDVKETAVKPVPRAHSFGHP